MFDGADAVTKNPEVTGCKKQNSVMECGDEPQDDTQSIAERFEISKSFFAAYKACYDSTFDSISISANVVIFSKSFSP